jgi:hypothetical protein
MQRRNAQRNIGRAKVYFMFWNNGVKVQELFESWEGVLIFEKKE